MQADIFLEISLVLVVATVVAGIMRLLRQPLIIGHIITGLLVGPSVFNMVQSTETAELFSHIGIALLLFIIGLGLNPQVIKEVGKVAIATGLGQILFTSVIGFGLARALGFAAVPALYIAIALTFSSTIIILKLLTDKKEQHRLYGKIATGFLLVQDVAAAIILLIVSGFTKDTALAELILRTLASSVILVGSLSLLALYVLPKLSQFFAHSQEALLLFSVGWGLGVASLCVVLGFSIEIGALAAGISLASTTYSYEISSRLRPLRDFFITLFFVVLGTRMSIDAIGTNIFPALVFSAFILIGNPLIVLFMLGRMGYTKKTSFMAGLTVAQISEFSLILILLGQQVGHLPASIMPMVTLVGIITIAACTYMVLYDDKLYKRLEPYLGWFERKKVKPEHLKPHNFDIVMFGYKGGTRTFLNAFKKLGRSYLVVDYDPVRIERLQEEGIPCRFGDATDAEFLDELNLNSAKLVVVNLTDYASNALIIDNVRVQNPKTVVIAMTQSDKIENAQRLYEKGANYVMMPHFLGTGHLSQILSKHGISEAPFEREKAKHQKYLLSEAG
jgi:Kef-type K+ transport system membrane component KefB